VISLGSIVWGPSPKIPIDFAYEKRRSDANMQYRVRVTVAAINDNRYFGYPIYLGLTIGGTNVGSATLKTSSPNRWADPIVYTSPWYTVANKTSGTTAVTFKMYSGSGCSRSDTYSYSMGVDPAMSTVKASDGTLGTALTLAVTRYNTAFTHSITYKCGSATGEICSKSTATSVAWNSINGNTLELARQNTAGTSVDVELTITTYNGTTPIGGYITKIRMAIPDIAAPSVKVTVDDATDCLDTYGAFVQGWSKLKITATPTLSYGSPINTYEVTADGKTYIRQTVTTEAVQNSGTLTISAKVTDARGRTSQPGTTDILVLKYSKPSVNVIAYRCNSSGVADTEGAYMKVGFTTTIANLNGHNSAKYTIKYGTSTITGTGMSYTSAPIACDVSQTMTVEVTVEDTLDKTTKAAVIPISFTLMDFYNTGKGVAFGKVATRDGFDCAMNAWFTGATAMPAGMTVGGKTLLNLIYPVGSIYMSVNNVSPATFLGGTWEQVKDTFLLAAGTTYSAGQTGGEATHKLTTSEMPKHNHYSMRRAASVDDYVKAGSNAYGLTAGSEESGIGYSSSYAGGDAAHNNMPPYLAVYMWKRTQ
jgi:hypothetical protein